jgi:hypothetical protein
MSELSEMSVKLAYPPAGKTPRSETVETVFGASASPAPCARLFFQEPPPPGKTDNSDIVALIY